MEAGPQSLVDETKAPCSFAALKIEGFCPLEIQCLTFERVCAQRHGAKMCQGHVPSLCVVCSSGDGSPVPSRSALQTLDQLVPIMQDVMTREFARVMHDTSSKYITLWGLT